MARHPFSVLLLLALLVPASVFAQYMYLDSNGDGVNTPADVIHGTGQTNVDVWLDSNHRRDGTEVACATGPGPINFGSSFTVVLRATNGSMACSNITPLQPLISTPLPVESSTTECAFSYFGAAYVGVGRFAVARLTLIPTGGTPSVSIVALPTTLSGSHQFTQFGSSCPAADFDNTMKLGVDWFDVDGLAFEPGGIISAPVFSSLQAMNVVVGETASQDFSVTDADGDALTLTIQTGPPFVTVTELNAGAGQVSARLHAHPRRGNEGVYDVVLSASDGQQHSESTVQVTVASGPDHPPTMASVPRLDVVASSRSRSILVASDSDGDPLQFVMTQGPSFAAVSTSQPGAGGATGVLMLQPTLCDVGSSSVTIEVRDGFAVTTMNVPVRVLAPAPPPSSTPAVSPLSGVEGVAVGDLNGDGHVDAVTVGESRAGLHVLVGDGTGNLTEVGSYLPDLGSIAVAVGDWNADGRLDVAAGGLGTQPLFVLYGRGDATFEAPVIFASVLLATSLTVADWNGDHVDDLVVAGRVNHLSVLLGHASTGLSLYGEIPMPSMTDAVVAADFDRDGILDVAAAPFREGILVARGRGDGTFGDIRAMGSDLSLYTLGLGDWDSDGLWDVAGTSFASPGLFLGSGDGTGAFAMTTVSTTYLPYYGLGVTDWNGDGNADLLITSEGGSAGLALGHGDGTFDLGTLGITITYNLAIADLDENGRPDVLGADGSLRVLLNPTTALTGAAAQAFTSGKMVTVVPSSRLLDVYLEPSGGTFDAQDIDPASVRMLSDGTGSVGVISAYVGKGATIGDADHDGVSELAASFRMDDLAQLFDQVKGKTSVSVRVQAALLDSRRLCAPLSMTIYVTGGGPLAARVEPNPLNPQGTLKFSVPRAGPVTVRLFDAQGKLVRTIWDRRVTEPGDQEVAIDGRTSSGQPMSTGVYFYRIETKGTSTSGRFAVLK